MADRIPEEKIAEIRTRASIVEVISSYVTLRRTGRSYVGLCPFHAEDTPSFNVNEERGFFHCFGCGAGGNVFTFLMRLEGLSFPEAVRGVAARFGLPLPSLNRDPREKEREDLYRINTLAMTYFRRSLWETPGEEARRYLSGRGLTKEIAERFTLGYAPPWESGLARFLQEQKVAMDKAVLLGLVGKRRGGGYYDRFRHRLIFPITDVVGRTIGFGGRLIGDREIRQRQRDQTEGGGGSLSPVSVSSLPKYLNSSDSPLYKKGASLYGLFQAKDAIGRKGRVLVVEGYIDALALVQNGFPETVAVLGTALGAEQLRLIRRFTQEVIAFFDGDAAGERAALRSFSLCVETGLWGKGAFLPQGHDPDSFVREHGSEEVERLLSQVLPLADFYLDRVDPGPETSMARRVQAAAEVAATLRKVKDPFAFSHLVRRAAERLEVGEEVLRASSPPAQERKERERRSRTSALEEAEQGLIELMLADPKIASRMETEGITPLFQTPLYRELAEEIVVSWKKAGGVEVGDFLDRLPKEVASRVVRRLMQGIEETEEERQRFLADCLMTIRRRQRQTASHRLRQEIHQAEQQGSADWKDHLKRWQELKAQELSLKGH